MNQRMLDIVKPITQSEVESDTILPDIDIDNFEDGFCDKTMTLKFRVNRHYKPHALSDNSTPDTASAKAMITTSLSYLTHHYTMFYIKDEALKKLYHVIDDPCVFFDITTNQYRPAQSYYIDRDTMTGIAIGSAAKRGNHIAVIGIFAPHGYSKIALYNQFTKKYLIGADAVE